jgi:hypothetical protein
MLLLTVRLCKRRVVGDGLSRQTRGSGSAGKRVGISSTFLVVLELDEGGRVRQPCVRGVGLAIFPVNEVLGPLLPLLLRLGGDGRLRREARLAKQLRSLVVSERVGVATAGLDGLASLYEGRSIGQASVGAGDLVISPVDVVLRPLLPFLLAAGFGERSISGRLGGKGRSTRTGKSEAGVGLRSLGSGGLLLGEAELAEVLLGVRSPPVDHMQVVLEVLLISVAGGKSAACLGAGLLLSDVDVEEARVNAVAAEPGGIVVLQADVDAHLLTGVKVSIVVSRGEPLAGALLGHHTSLDNTDGLGAEVRHAVDVLLLLLEVLELALDAGHVLLEGGKLASLERKGRRVVVLVLAVAFELDGLHGRSK